MNCANVNSMFALFRAEWVLPSDPKPGLLVGWVGDLGANGFCGGLELDALTQPS